MSHNDFLRPGNLIGNVTVPVAADLEKIDQSCVECWDIVNGGAYYPKTPICLGGAGGQFSAGNTRIQGGLETRKGGRLVLGASDYATFSSPRSRQTAMQLRRDRYRQSSRTSTDTGIVSAVANDSNAIVVPIEPKTLHNTGRLTYATLIFYVGQAHTGVPANLPTMEIKRVAADGTVVSLGAPVADGGTYVTGDDWYKEGGVHNIIYATSANNVIDTTRYSYVILITDELGANSLALNRYEQVGFLFDSIADMSPC